MKSASLHLLRSPEKNKMFPVVIDSILNQQGKLINRNIFLTKWTLPMEALPWSATVARPVRMPGMPASSVRGGGGDSASIPAETKPHMFWQTTLKKQQRKARGDGVISAIPAGLLASAFQTPLRAPEPLLGFLENPLAKSKSPKTGTRSYLGGG